MATIWTTQPLIYSQLPGVDPALDWVLPDGASGRRYYFVPGDQTKWLSVVLLLNKVGVSDFAKGIPFIPESDVRETWQKNLSIPHFFIVPPQGLEKLNFCAALATKWFFDTVTERRLVPDWIARIELSLPFRARSLPHT